MRIAVLASGGGSNLQALIDHMATPAGTLAGQIVLVASNRDDAGAMARARTAGIATHVVSDPADSATLLTALHDADVELLVLAGYLKLVPADVVRAFHGRMLNVHPALLPAYGGTGMYGHHIHEAVLSDGALTTGVTVHFVDEQYDRGPIIAQWPVPVLPGDDARTLAARVLRIEHRLFPLIVEAVAARRIELGADGRAHGHLDAILPPAAPELRFALTIDHGSTTSGHDTGTNGLSLDLARLFHAEHRRNASRPPLRFRQVRTRSFRCPAPCSGMGTRLHRRHGARVARRRTACPRSE